MPQFFIEKTKDLKEIQDYAKQAKCRVWKADELLEMLKRDGVKNQLPKAEYYELRCKDIG